MLSISYTKIFKFIFSKYPNPADAKPQKLTKAINDAKTSNDIKRIIQANQGNFNLVNLSALLRKIRAPYLQGQSILNLVYKQVKTNFTNMQPPTLLTTRAIANIIGYTGNLRYHGIDNEIKKVDFLQLAKLSNDKQFVMAVTGILKLQLVDQLLKKQQLNQIVTNNIGRNESFGLLVSLWRNLIKWNKTNKQLNKLFACRLGEISLSSNLKDLGYFIYCFTQAHQDIQNKDVLLGILRKCSQNTLESNRINIFQFCIFVQHLAKLENIFQLEISQQFVDLMNTHYIRIITEKVDLRSLANGFLSLQSFKALKGKIDNQSYCVTALAFIEHLTDKWENISDYEAVTSLFVQLITNSPQNLTNFSPSDYHRKYFKYPNSLNIITPLLNFAFNPKSRHIHKMSNKQYQKFVYGLYLYKKHNILFTLQQNMIKMLKQSLLSKPQINQLQLNSIIVCFNVLNIRDEEICIYVKNIAQEKKFNISNKNSANISNNSCIIGLRKQQCKLCYKMQNENKQNKILI